MRASTREGETAKAVPATHCAPYTLLKLGVNERCRFPNARCFPVEQVGRRRAGKWCGGSWEAMARNQPTSPKGVRMVSEWYPNGIRMVSEGYSKGIRRVFEGYSEVLMGRCGGSAGPGLGWRRRGAGENGGEWIGQAAPTVYLLHDA